MDSWNNLFLSEEDLIPLLTERLAEGQTVRYLPFRGTSMLPLLRQGKDSVQLSPLPERLEKYDLPVYRYPSGKYVMHRVVRTEQNHYICLGDNTYRYEYITRDMMIGIVTAIRRGDHVISVKNPVYRAYCRLWCSIFPVRLVLWKGKNLLRKWLKG
jgi:hypothetical protein